MLQTLKTNKAKSSNMVPPDLGQFVPAGIAPLKDPQTDLPRIAKDPRLIGLIESAIQQVPTTHNLWLGDSRNLSVLAPNSVQLVLTSPPYWTLKEYRDSEGQLGHVEDYEAFLRHLSLANQDVRFL